jgi:hypothetical protein
MCELLHTPCQPRGPLRLIARPKPVPPNCVGGGRAGRHPSFYQFGGGTVAAGDPHRADRVRQCHRPGWRRLRQTKGNADQQSTCRAQSLISVSQALERIRKVAKGKEEGEVHRALPPHQHRATRAVVLRARGDRCTWCGSLDVEGLRGSRGRRSYPLCPRHRGVALRASCAATQDPPHQSLFTCARECPQCLQSPRTAGQYQPNRWINYRNSRLVACSTHVRARSPMLEEDRKVRALARGRVVVGILYRGRPDHDRALRAVGGITCHGNVVKLVALFLVLVRGSFRGPLLASCFLLG